MSAGLPLSAVVESDLPLSALVEWRRDSRDVVMKDPWDVTASVISPSPPGGMKDPCDVKVFCDVQEFCDSSACCYDWDS